MIWGNGNNVACSFAWDNDAIADVGASTWANGSNATIGVVSQANSLVGASTGDRVGGGSFALTNGNYVVSSLNWANGANPDAGAASWGSGNTGVSATISAGNPRVGASTDDGIAAGSASYEPIVALSNGNYTDAGAVMILRNFARSHGLLSIAHSVLGSASGGGAVLSVAQVSFLDRAVVGRLDDNPIAVRALALFADGLD